MPPCTSAGRITRSPSMYPFCTTAITCPLSTSSAGSCEIASWKFGSNAAPSASMRLHAFAFQMFWNLRAISSMPFAQASSAGRFCRARSRSSSTGRIFLMMSPFIEMYDHLIIALDALFYNSGTPPGTAASHPYIRTLWLRPLPIDSVSASISADSCSPSSGDSQTCYGFRFGLSLSQLLPRVCVSFFQSYFSLSCIASIWNDSDIRCFESSQ